MDDQVRRRIRTVLPDCRLTFVRSRSQLVKCLCTEGFDLVLIGSQFESVGPLAGLSDAVRTQPACPVVCLATRAFGPWTQHPGTYAEFRSACLERGAYDTLDLTRWRDDTEGNAHVRHLLESVPLIGHGAGE